MKNLILILSAMFTLQAYADNSLINFIPDEDNAPATKPMLIYFGGVGATQNDMNAFERQAKRDSKVGGIYEIETVKWLGGGNRRGGPSSTKEGRRLVAHYADLIAAHPEREFIIAGHSAGSDMLNAIVDHIRPPKGKTRIPNLKVINLDGFHPSSSEVRKAEQICWSVKNKSGQRSPGFSFLASSCSSFHVATTSKCSSKWCLHTQIVNHNGQSVGAVYANLKANFEWVPQVEVAKNTGSSPAATANVKDVGAAR